MRAALAQLAKSRLARFGRRLLARYLASRPTLLAAALAYYAAFSLGPLLLLLAGGIGLLLQGRPELALQYQSAVADLLGQLLPPEADSAALAEQSLRTLVAVLGEGAWLRNLVSLGLLLWASSNFFISLQQALEVIFDAPRPRGYWRKRGIALLLVLAVFAVIAVEVIGGALLGYLEQLLVTLHGTLSRLGLDLPRPTWRLGWLGDPLRAGVAVAAFTLSFRYLPRQQSTWPAALGGATLSVAGIQMSRLLLETVFSVERFNVIYGLITNLLAVLLWLYVSLLLFLLGGVLAAELSRQDAKT